MSIPGQNILAAALSIIAKQTFTYSAFIGRSLASNADQVPTYTTPITVQGSVQPVPRHLFEQMGLSFQSNYANFYVPQSVLDIARGVAGDQFIFNGQTYEAISKTPWHAIDGWDAVLCIQVTRRVQ